MNNLNLNHLQNFLISQTIEAYTKKPIPRGAGIIFILFTIFSSFFYLFIYGQNPTYLIPISIIPLSIVGLFDDLYSLNPFVKYTSQIFVSILIFH